MKKIRQIIERYESHYRGYSWIYFFDEIPAEKLEKAKQSYAIVLSDETPLVLMLSDTWRSGKKGYLLTDRKVFSNYKETVVFAWEELENVYHSGETVFINDKPFMHCKVPSENDWNQFLMLHEIFRNMTGKASLFCVGRSIEFPNNCVSCISNLCEKKIPVKMWSPPKPNWISRNWAKAGLLGLPFNILFGGTYKEIPFEYSIPICRKCWLNLTRDEKNGLHLGWIWSTLLELTRWLAANRHISINIPETNKVISSWEDLDIEVWFRNVEFASKFCKLNGIFLQEMEKDISKNLDFSQLSIEEVLDHLHNDNPRVRMEAITSLASKSSINVVPRLINMLDEENQMVRLRATEALYWVCKVDLGEEVNFGEDKDKWMKWWEQNKVRRDW